MNSPLQVPLVVPSFSSRGFPQDRHRLHDVTRRNFRKFAGEFDALLVSAFDLHFGYIRSSDIPSGRTIFVDSGGYESHEWEDDSATHLKLLPHVGQRWTQSRMLKTIRALPDESRFIYVNYDLEADLLSQIHSAERQLRFLRKARRSFLLKEEPLVRAGNPVPGQMVPLRKTLLRLPKVIDELRAFDVFGVTEKSLGRNYYDRLANLQLLHGFLRRNKLEIPVHVFGALDPLTVRIYALAGADIFDGLTWIRFAYRKQQCIYLSNDILARSDLRIDFTEGREAVFNENYLALLWIERDLRAFRETGDPAKLRLPKPIFDKARRALIEARESKDYRRLVGP